MFDTFGNKVRIRKTPETEEKRLAGKEGEVYGQTTPSMMDFEIIGDLKRDFAINVHFEDLGDSFWFAEELLEYLDNGQGTVISLDGIEKKWIKGANGEWIEKDMSSTNEKNEADKHADKKSWWKFWK